MEKKKKKYGSFGKRRGKLKITLTVVLAALLFLCLYFFVFEALRPKVENGTCEFHFIDVGQGDCTMFISENDCVVIDAGPRACEKTTLGYIHAYTDNIDYLILTHPDEDHIGGAACLINGIRVKNVIMTDAVKDTYVFDTLLDALEKRAVNLIKAEPGAKFDAGDIGFTVLAPIGEFSDYNNYSIVTKVEYGESSVIVTGDAETYSETAMMEKYGTTLCSDVLKLAHHGSSTSTGEEFFRTVSPEFAVISCGKDNSYGHPHRETLELLKKYGVEYYRTDKEGTVILVSDGKTVKHK